MDGDDDPTTLSFKRVRQFTVRIENISDSASLSTLLGPGVWAVHEQNDPLFTDGAADRGDGLEALAEDGNPGPLAGNLNTQLGIVMSNVFNTPAGSDEPGPIVAGGVYEFTVAAVPGYNLSFSTMFVESNDLFFCPEGSGIDLSTITGTDPVDVTDQIDLWDAGTEVNQEPGVGPDQAPRQAGPNTGINEDGVVQLIGNVEDGFTYPGVDEVIRVTITPVEGFSKGVLTDNVGGAVEIGTVVTTGQLPLTYTPNFDELGIDEISYVSIDSNGAISASAMISITIGGPPWYPLISFTPLPINGGTRGVAVFEWYNIWISPQGDTQNPVFQTNLNGTVVTPDIYFLGGFDGFIPGRYEWFYRSWEPEKGTGSDAFGDFIPEDPTSEGAFGNLLEEEYEAADPPTFPDPPDDIVAVGPGKYEVVFTAGNARGYSLEIRDVMDNNGIPIVIQNIFSPREDGTIPLSEVTRVSVDIKEAGEYSFRVAGFNPVDELMGQLNFVEFPSSPKQITETIIDFSDSTFNLTDWELDVIASPLPSTGATHSQASGGLGNPDPYLEIVQTLGGTPVSSIVSIHTNLTTSYSPRIDGAILTIAYQENARTLETENMTFGASTTLALRQDGKFYVANFEPTRDDPESPDLPSSWKTIRINNLISEDFILVTGPNEFDNEQHPDFSVTGSSLSFGFARNNSHIFANSVQRVSAIDNWSVSLRTDPINPSAPQTLSLIRGWNLISLSIVPSSSRVGDIFQSHITGFAWSWAQDLYTPTNVLTTKTGYWFFCPDDGEVFIDGTPESDAERAVGEGWQLIGSLNTIPIPQNIVGPAWTWDGQHFVTEISALEPGKGYWIFLNQSGVLSLKSQ